MKKKLIITSVIILLILIMPQLIKGAELETGDYAVTDTYISRINPETTIGTFKTNVNASSLKVYKNENKTQEVTTGNVGTNMCIEHEGKTRTLSVIGDLNEDGNANQLDLSIMIRHILGFRDGQITDDMKKLSADITGDNNINNVDITALIRYNIFGEFYITVSAPEIKNMSTSTTTDSVKITVTAENAENGIYQYSYKEEGTSNYIEATKTKETSYTITGLKANTKYTVMVRVTNKYGMADKEEKEVTTVKNADTTPPTIREVASSSTTNSVTLEVTATDDDSGVTGNYTFYIKETSAADSTYEKIQENNQESVTEDSLKQNTSYTIKVEVSDAQGNKGTFTKEITTKTMPSITNPDGSKAITQKGNTIWNNGKASIEFETSTGYTIQYQVNGTTGEWKTGDKVENLNSGDKVYVRLWDETNGSEEIEFTIEDTVPPTVTEVSSNSTTDSVTLEVEATDNESGLEGNYTFYIKETSAADSTYEKIQDSNQVEVTKNGLKENTSYTVKVEVLDVTGNKGTFTKEITTKTMPSITNPDGSKAITQKGNTIWNNGKASIEFETSTGYTIQYQVNGTTGEWKTGDTVENLNNGDKVYVRLWDGTNGNEEIEFTIEDTVPPTVTEVSSNSTTDSVTLEVEATDNESGLEGNYTFYIKETSAADSTYEKIQDSNQVEVTKNGLKDNTSYTIKVEVLDVASNKGEFTKEIETKQIPSITNPDGSAGITQKGNITWTNGKASIEFETSTGYEIEYQVNGTEGTWQKGNKAENLNNGDNVYVRLSDGTNTTDSITFTIEDKTAPAITEVLSSTTTSTLAIQVMATDSESGLPATPKYVFYIKETSQADSEYVKVQESDNTSLTKTGLTQNTSYTVKVEVQDNATNTGLYIKELITTSIEGATDGLETGTITATAPVWNGGKATITLSTTTNKTIEWQKNNTTGEWSQGTNVTDLNHNDTVYARLTDGTNAGQEGSITIRDNQNPGATISVNATNCYTYADIPITITLKDNETGIDLSNCKWIYNTDSTKEIDEATYTNTFTKETEQVTLNVEEAGTYYFHVLTKDRAGNKEQIISNAINITKEPEAFTSVYTQTATYTDSEGNTATIPKGYSVGTTSSINKINNGLVIQDESGNQFVWIPVPDPTKMFEIQDGENVGILYDFWNDSTFTGEITALEYPGKNTGYREPDIVTGSTNGKGTSYDGNTDILATLGYGSREEFATALQTEFDNMVESVKKYKGFYIGRYETGNLDLNAETVSDPVVKRYYASNCADWYESYIGSKKITPSNGATTVEMIWGCQWDRALIWLVESGDKTLYEFAHPNEWGNYQDSTGAAASYCGRIRNTGQNEAWRANNIYDLAGNAQEWTMEAYKEHARILKRRLLWKYCLE